MKMFHIALYRSEDDEGGDFTAHSLDMDLVGDGDTWQEAMMSLLDTMDEAIRVGRDVKANYMRDAPDKYWPKRENVR